MKKFIADWKNPALLGAGIVILLLLVLVIIESGRSMSARLVSVGNKKITRQDLLNRLKILGGANEILRDMAFTDLMVAYARRQNITATEEELRQFDRYEELFEATPRGKTLEEFIREMGITMEQWHNFNSDKILLTKLIVPADDIKMAVSTNADRYTFPAWYRYLRFIIPQEEKAKEAYELLKEPEGAAMAAKFSVFEPGARQDGMRFYIDGYANDYPDIIDKLDSLKAGEISKPFQLPAQEGNPMPWVVVKALDIHPLEKPTVENRGMIAGYAMLTNSNTKYAQRQQDILSEAFQKIDMTFSPAVTEFTMAYEQLKDMQNKSIYIPPATGSPMQDVPDAGSAPRGAEPAPTGPQPAPNGR